MFPPIPPIINVDMIYQYQPNAYVGFGFNPTPIMQQIPQQNPFLSQLIHTQQQIINSQINSQILQNVSSMFAQQQHQQQQQHHQQHQQQQLQITSSQSSLPMSSTTEINENDLTSFHQETNFGDKIKFATWNVRGAIEMDKRMAIDKCLNEKMVQIACIQETKLQMGQLETANYRWHFITPKMDHSIHCGTAILVKHSFNGAVTNFEAVTGNILSCFVRSKDSTILLVSAHLTEEIGTEVEFERLKNFLKLYESLPTIIFGDFNAQLGKTDLVNSDHVFMGRFLYHDKCNNNGRLLKDLASEAKLFIKNTFRSHKIYKWKLILTTCRLKDRTSSSKAIESQIDHVLTSRDGIVFVKMLRGYYRNNVKTDHKMIVADIEIRSNEREANENVMHDCIDLSLDDDVPGNSQNVDNRTVDHQDSTNENRLTRKELREKLSQHRGDSLTNDRSSSKQNPINSISHQSTIDIASDNSEIVEKSKMQISPGEPVPPGFEDVVKPVAELQVILSKYRTSPMIGLEYIIELIMGDRRPRTYHCALCDKICDTKEIIDHIKSYEHRCKYLEKHYSSVMLPLSQYRKHSNAKSVLAGVIEAVCDSIEDAYGRLVPSVFENNDYTTNRTVYMKRLALERHFDERNEKSSSTFVQRIVDHKAIQSAFEKLAEASATSKPITTISKRSRCTEIVTSTTRAKRNSFDSISSSDSMSASIKSRIDSSMKEIEGIVAEQINLDLISSDSDDDSHAKKRKRSNSHRSTSYLKNEETEDFKYERYRTLTEQAVKSAKNLLQEYEKYPEKHPMYPSEWKRYWTRRSKEMEAVGMDPLKFDFSAEWSKYWLRRLRELYEDEIALKKFEIRKKVDLSPDYYPRSSSYNYNDQPSSSSSSFGYAKDETRTEKSQRERAPPLYDHYPKDPVPEHVMDDDEPLTVISVLRLLAALEDLLGATLGKKILDLLSKAVHLEKLKANLADDVLMNEENSVLLDTVKEKLKGLLIAKIVNNQQINAVRRAIRNVDSIVAVIDDKISVVSKTNSVTVPNVISEKPVTNSNGKTWTTTEQSNNSQTETHCDSRSEITKQIATAFLIQKINISKEQLEELTDDFILQSRESAETPYLYGVRVSQKEFSPNASARSQSSSSYGHATTQQPQSKPQSLIDGGTGFAFSLFDRSARNNIDHSPINSSNCGNYSNRRTNNSNSVNDSYSSHNPSQSFTNPNNQTKQKFRSSDQFNQPNSSQHQNSFNKSLPQQNNHHHQQRFQQQKPNAAKSHHQQPQNSSNKQQHTTKMNHFNQRKQNSLPIWESDAISGSNQSSHGHGQSFDQKTMKMNNSIWDTNPMQQQQSQQQFNSGTFQQNSKRQPQQQQSHYNNFYQQNQHQQSINSPQSIWDHQFPQQQTNRNSRHH